MVSFPPLHGHDPVGGSHGHPHPTATNSLPRLAGRAAAWPLVARAQQPTMPVVGFLGAESASTNRHFFDAFRDGMREHGYIDGQNVALWSDGPGAEASVFLNSSARCSGLGRMLFWQ